MSEVSVGDGGGGGVGGRVKRSEARIGINKSLSELISVAAPRTTSHG